MDELFVTMAMAMTLTPNPNLNEAGDQAPATSPSMSIIRIEFQLLRPKLPAFKENNGHLSNGLSTLV